MSAASSFYTVYAVMFVIYHTSASHSSLTYLRLHGARRWSDSGASRFGLLQPQNVAQKPRPKSSKFPWSWKSQSAVSTSFDSKPLPRQKHN